MRAGQGEVGAPRWLLPAVVALPAALGFLLVGSAFVDDVHITLFAAEALADTGSVLNHAGDRIEQSSSLLHVLLLGGLHAATGVSIDVLAWWTGVVAAGALVAVAWHLAESLRPGTGAAAGLFVALSAGVVQWGVGGLETTLGALAYLVVLASWSGVIGGEVRPTPRRVAAMGGSVLLYLLARPEAPYVLVAVLVGVAGLQAVFPGARRGRPVLRAAMLAATVGGVAIAVAGARLAYFGAPIPQPVSTKAGDVAVRRGLAYLQDRLADAPGLVVLLVVAVVACVLAARAGHTAWLVVAMGAPAIGAFVVAAGGDWMPGPRLLVPAVAPAAVAAAVLLGHRRVLVAGVVALELVGIALLLRSTSVGVPVWQRDELAAVTRELGVEDVAWPVRTSRIGLRDQPTVAALEAAVAELHATHQRPVTVASHQAGLVARHLASMEPGIVEFVDLAALTDDRFSSCDELLVDSIFGEVVDADAWLDGTPPCGVQRPPDLVFALGPFDRHAAASHEYVPVHATVGRLAISGPWGGVPLRGEQFVAVHRDLLGSLPPDVGGRLDFERWFPL